MEGNCPLCKVWEMMPYHKRWSTPMTPQEAEGGMAAGWWAAFKSIDAKGNRNDFDGSLCARHEGIMTIFDQQHNERKRIENASRVVVVPEHAAQVQEYLARAQALAKPPPAPEPAKPAPIIPVLYTAPQAPMPNPEPPPPLRVMTSPPPVAAMTAPPPPPSATVFPCPICGKEVSSGAMHMCAVEEEAVAVKK